MWDNDHSNPNHLTATEIHRAIAANPEMTAREVIAQIYDGLVAIFNGLPL